jgi:DNA invertase Pin-like site-specific DNA recombinase
VRGRTVDVGYARVSTVDQDLTIQLEALERAGIHPSLIHAEKVSGDAKRLPVREQTLAQLQPGDTLAVHRLDRLGRSVAEVLKIVEDLEARKIAFRCLTQPIDTSTPAGKAFLGLLAVFAAFEKAMILERTAAGKARRKARGLPNVGRRLFGTTGVGPTAVSEEQAEVEARQLREAAQDLVNGVSLSKIVDTWNQAEWWTTRGGSWTATSLRRVLLNPRSEEILGQGPFRAVARVLDNRGNRRRSLGRPTDHILSGILRCGREGCGQAMYHATKVGKPGGPPQDVYRCKAQNGGRFNGCGLTQVSQSRADAWAAEAFIAAVASDDFADALNRRQAELLAEDATVEELEDWRAEIADLEQVMPTRFAPPDAKERHAQLQRMVREATARLMAQPEIQEMLDFPGPRPRSGPPGTAGVWSCGGCGCGASSITSRCCRRTPTIAVRTWRRGSTRTGRCSSRRVSSLFRR